jgi:hypothetical protein
MTGTLRAITDENRRLVRQRTEEIIKVHNGRRALCAS